jgi:hypothetical protein
MNLQDTLFLHFQFHKDGISWHQIREEFEEHLGSIRKEEVDIARTIVAFSRTKNIGDFVTRAKLHEAPSKLVSKIMGEYKMGLNPY